MIEYRKEPWKWKQDFEGAVDKNELVGAESGKRILYPVQGWSRRDLGLRTGEAAIKENPGPLVETPEMAGNAMIIQHGPELMDIAQAAKALSDAPSGSALKILKAALDRLPKEMLE